jgi:hypothetical protein
MLYRVDTTGSLVLYSSPRFYPPVDIVGEIDTFDLHHSLDSMLQYWNLMFPALTDISAAISSLSRLAFYANETASKSAIGRGEMFSACKIYPVAHQLLSLPRYLLPVEQSQFTQGINIREVLKLAATVLIGLLTKKCGTYPDGVAENMIRASCLLKELIDWSCFRALQLWVLVIFAIADHGCGVEKILYVPEVARTMKDMDLCHWDQVLDVLKDIIWIDEVMASGCEMLKHDTELFQFMI